MIYGRELQLSDFRVRGAAATPVAIGVPGREPAALLEVMREPPHGGQQEPKVRRRRLDGPGQKLRVVLNPNEKG